MLVSFDMETPGHLNKTQERPPLAPIEREAFAKPTSKSRATFPKLLLGSAWSAHVPC